MPALSPCSCRYKLSDVQNTLVEVENMCARQVLCPSQAVGVEAANSDDGRPAAAGDVSLSGGELHSMNYGQQIRRQEI